MNAEYFALQSIKQADLCAFRKRAVMTTHIDLKQIEEKTRASYFEDGFADIGMGLAVLALSLLNSVLFSDSKAAVLLCQFFFLVALVTPAIARRYITYPRMGQVKLRSTLSGNRGRILLFVTCFATGLVSLEVGLASYHDLLEMPNLAGAALMGAGWLLLFGTVGYFARYRLMYAYGLLMAISWALNGSVDNPAGQIMMYASVALMVAIGLARTIRFFRKYQKARVEDMNANGPG